MHTPKTLTTIIVAGFIAVASNAMAGTAVKSDTNTNPKAKSEGGEAVSDLAIARELVKYGEKNNDPIALMLGAKIMKNNPTREGDAVKKPAKGQGSGSDNKLKSDRSAAAALERARALAKDQPELLAMIEDVEKSSSRALAGRRSSGLTSDRVLPRRTDVYRLTFRGNRTAAVLVDGDGDTDLDLFIYDENGNLICSDTDRTDTCVCSWTPSWTGDFNIHIKNLGRVSNYYDMLVQ